MQLLVIRHAIAVDRGQGPDADRPLTKKGKKRMNRGAAGLKALVPDLDVLATSRLLRAKQTAAIVARHHRIEPVEIDELAPGVPLSRLLDWLRLQAVARLAIVGHEDGLSTFASWLISGRSESHLTLKKGGACLVEISESLVPGTAVLRWLLTPKQLRRMV
jgi:phosphohistidine phosphatase